MVFVQKICGSKIKIYDCIPSGDDYEHLRLSGTTTLSVDRNYNLPVFNLKFDGWFENSVHLWPRNAGLKCMCHVD